MVVLKGLNFILEEILKKLKLLPFGMNLKWGIANERLYRIADKPGSR
jgi:hypothetical protein